jgi:hypothetical protein
MEELLLTGGKPRPLPHKKAPTRELAKLFYMRRKELSEKADALPSVLSKDVDSLYSNARNIRRMLKEQGISARSPEDVLGYFGTAPLVELELSGAEISNPKEAAKSLGRDTLSSPSAPKELNRSVLRELGKIQSHKRLDDAQKLAYGLFLADLVAAQEFTLATLIRSKVQTEFSEHCGKFNSLPHNTRLPHPWWMMLGAAVAAFSAGATTFIDKFKLGTPLREALISGAAVFGAVLGGGILLAGKLFRTDRKLLHERLGKVSKALEVMEMAYNEVVGIVASMESLQKNIMEAIAELGRRSNSKPPQSGD